MSDTADRPRVRTALDDRVWRITLDRPEAGNAVDARLAADLAAALRGTPEAARAVLLDAAGPRFCVGGDVRQFAGAPDLAAFVGDLARDWHATVRVLLDLHLPVVAAVHGAVAGAGVGLMSACDIVVCARSTRIRPAYLGLGFSPDGGTSWALTRALGLPRALDLMLTDGSLTADEAHAAGLVARVTDDDALPASAGALARQLAEGPVRAMARTRALARRALSSDLTDHLDAEALLIAASAADPEGIEGVRAFVDRRPPDFLHR
ncbi:enoyl-CoA hydratase/isomerase family protein [Trujillonella humicola]|uniref:enoyl-CoA hydratase/isomerase family protein n=1 Tax=Trujillonella humicola TaxID=3383699 RepID=UPI003905B500